MIHKAIPAMAALASLAATLPATAATWEEDDAKIAACFTTMDRDPALAVVNAKFARREPTPAQLADQTFASAEEADALRLRVQRTRPCRTLRLDAVSTHRPLLEPAYKTLYYQADQVFEYLTQGWIGYGTANRLSHGSLAAFRGREQSYKAAHTDDERRALSQAWSERLQQAHSNPPPDGARTKCEWQALNIACER